VSVGSDDPGPARPGTLATALAAARPRSALEAADLARLRSLAASPAAWDRAAALHVTGSALVVHPPTARVLLRWHERMQGWLQVGGHGDPGEDDPLAVARREAREETGLDDLVPWPDAERPVLLHAVVVPVPAAGDEPAHEHGDLRYLLATAHPERARPERPGAPLRWLHLDEAVAAVGEDNLRVTLARAAALLRSDQP